MFVTAVYGALDPRTGVFTYANAGHNPPFWLYQGGMELLTRTGIALGVIEHAHMEERSIRLSPGDLLMFYTDGVTEAFSSEGEIFGDERLRQVLSNLNQGTAQNILEEIEAVVDDFIGDYPASDDITLIALKRKE
jgi:sigma-B regulation protein RsbU (phosphoserine phosphatase)